MIEKLARAFSKLRGEVSALSQRIDSLPTPKDGVSPKAEDIAALVKTPTAEEVAALVLERMPAPKDGRNGKDADARAIIQEVLAQIPKPKDGRDAQPPALADVAALVAAQTPKPKDGKDGRNGKDGRSPTATEVAAALPAPERGPQGKEGRPGKDGASVTNVKLEKSTLFVWIDGVKKRVGKIDIPVPQFIGGGGGPTRAPTPQPQNVQLVELGTFATTATQTPTGTGDGGKIRVNFGAGGTTTDGEFTVAPDGTITCNKNGIQYDFDLSFRIARNGAAGESEIMGRLMYAPDGVEANATQVGETFAVKIDDDDTIWRQQFEVRFSPEVGSLLWFELARNPGGNNSGQLETVQPAGDISGWNPSNTASITFGKLVTF